MKKYNRYRKFREDTYSMLRKAKDTTFELMDSILTTKNVYSLAELSLCSCFRRKWHSTYEAIEDCRINRNKMMKRYIKEIPEELEYVLLGIDNTPWEFKNAKTMKEREYKHQEASKNKVIKGHGYSTIAWLPEKENQDETSWALPLRHERITSFETAITKAVWQIKQVDKWLKKRKLVVLDCEYGNGSMVSKIEGIEVSLLMRIRSNSCLYGEPEKYSGKGRPKKHGRKFKINDVSTHTKAGEIIEIADKKLGLIRVSKWKELHFKTASKQKVSLIKVERLKLKPTGKKHKPLWLVWVGEEFLSLDKVWSKYARRFGVDHWYRFAKQRLHWTLPNFGTPHQCQRWSDLMPNLTWQLWLARELVEDHHLPWQKPQTTLTPGRVAQSIFPLLMEIGSPTIPPKTRGNSPGSKKGQKRTKRKTYPMVKRRYSPPKKSKKQAA